MIRLKSRTHMAYVVAVCVIIALSASTAYALSEAPVSTFDTDDEGWRIWGDAQSGSVLPSYFASENCIYAVDNVAGGVWYFIAPEKFLGDKSAYYGGSLLFDLKQSDTSNPFNSDDVVLIGNGLTLKFDTPNNPGKTWTSYSVELSETAGWTYNGRAATQAEMVSALSALTTLRIRGEYRTGSDTGYLDNVQMQAVPEPSTLAALAIGLSACGFRLRKK